MRPPDHTPKYNHPGRPDIIPDATGTPRMNLDRVDMLQGGLFDKGGAYWGEPDGRSIYWGRGRDNQGRYYEVWVKAGSRAEARAEVKKKIPGAWGQGWGQRKLGRRMYYYYKKKQLNLAGNQPLTERTENNS